MGTAALICWRIARIGRAIPLYYTISAALQLQLLDELANLFRELIH